MKRIRIQHLTRVRIQHATRIRIQHVTRIRIQHVMRIRILHVMRIIILHVKKIYLVPMRTTVNEDGGGRSGHHFLMTKGLYAEGGERHTGTKLWRASNESKVFDFNTRQSHPINDGRVISNSIIDGVLESSLRVTIYYILWYITVCAFYK